MKEIEDLKELLRIEVEYRKKLEFSLKAKELEIESLKACKQPISGNENNSLLADTKVLSEKIESISKFTVDSPNPILRCSFDGKLLYANSAAKTFVSLLTTFPYNTN